MATTGGTIKIKFELDRDGIVRDPIFWMQRLAEWATFGRYKGTRWQRYVTLGGKPLNENALPEPEDNTAENFSERADQFMRAWAPPSEAERAPFDDLILRLNEPPK